MSKHFKDEQESLNGDTQLNIEGFKGDEEYVLPVEEKDRDYEKSGTKRNGSVKDDYNDYIYMTPVRGHHSSHNSDSSKKKKIAKSGT